MTDRSQAHHVLNNARPVWAHSIAEAALAIREGRLTPMDFVEACIARSGEVDPMVHSYLHLDADAARRLAPLAAAEIAAGRDRGVLHGLPFAVKANYDVAGLPSCAGSRLLLDRRPATDARLVAQLRERGAICLGLLSTWEYGTGNGGEYFDLPFAPARNPWDTARFSGGSSAGCGAAVIAGTALFALGSDTTGSVRLPAAATGTVGLIPTPGRLSLDGILPNCYSLDVPGTFTRTAEDAAVLFGALGRFGPGETPPDVAALASAGIAGSKIAVLRDPGHGFPQPDAPLAAGFEAALRVLQALGARLVDVHLPVPAAECLAVTRMIGPAESASIHERDLHERPDLMGFALRDKLLGGSLVTAVDYLAALRRRAQIAQGLHDLLDQCDALVTFGTLHLPPRLGVEPEMTAYTVETMLTPFNLSGNPALVQCTGFSAERLPLHWQVVARQGREVDLLRVAIAYERATGWRDHLPVPTPHPPPPTRAAQVPPASAVSIEEVAGYARRHGLERLDPAQLSRMRELVAPVAAHGIAVRRIDDKHQGPYRETWADRQFSAARQIADDQQPKGTQHD